MHNNIYELEISECVLNKFINLSQKGKKTHMKDLSIIEEQEKIKELISEIINIDSFHYANLFNHSKPFAVHSDISYKKKAILLIPIAAHSDQKFIVFDQTVNSNHEVSWIYNIFDDKSEEELRDMYYDSALKVRPVDCKFVNNCVKDYISEKLYKELPYSKELYYGLTGFAWKYTPGKALLFPANRIHATGKMKSKKIGCTVQFKEPVNNLEILTTKRILS